MVEKSSCEHTMLWRNKFAFYLKGEWGKNVYSTQYTYRANPVSKSKNLPTNLI